MAIQIIRTQYIWQYILGHSIYDNTNNKDTVNMAIQRIRIRIRIKIKNKDKDKDKNKDNNKDNKLE